MTTSLALQTPPGPGLPPSPPGRPAAPHSYCLGSDGPVCNCPPSPPGTVGVYVPGSKGYWLTPPSGYSYVWSQYYLGSYTPPAGECYKTVEFWLFNDPAPTTAGYYTFSGTVTPIPGVLRDCPKTQPPDPDPTPSQ